MKRAVITGPTGAVGIALMKVLIQNGVEVLAIVREGSKRADRIPESPLIKVLPCSLENLGTVRGRTEGSYDVFYHFGWDGTFGNARNNVRGQLTNVKYTLDAVDLAEALGCGTFIGAGSQAEYGRAEGRLDASVPVFPENGYGMAKLCAGQMSRLACEQKNIRHIWTRILSVYGPYDGDNTMIMSVIRKLLQGEKPSLTKGEQQWDYLYSMDAGKAFYLLGDKGVHGRVYCVGSGEAKMLKEYITEIRDHIDPDAPLGIGDLPYGDKQVMYLCANTDALRKDTGFVPDYSFSRGIEETIQWVRKQKA